MKKLATYLLTFFVFAISSGLALAQSADEDRGYLQGFLEDNLSDAGRQVRITGFAGALSSRATIDELTIADDKGVWITLRKLTLDWNRSALLGGKLDITELSAEEILLPRTPEVSGNSAPSPEATSFSLPDLPVSIKIGALRVEKLVLGEALFGEATVVSVEGMAQLEGGAGQASLAVNRIDGIEGTLSLKGSFANATRFLDLDLSISEPKNGIAANLIGLPGTPSVELAINGAGPLNDFVAEIALSTDNEPRLEGRLTLNDVSSETEESEDDHRAFSLNIGGDIAPLFLPDYRAFFGSDIRLELSGARFEDGRVRLDDLTLNTRTMQLTGQLALGVDNWPESFLLTGEIADDNGAPVLLPLSGTPTRLNNARLKLEYDREVGDVWRAEIYADTVKQTSIEIAQLRLTGSGSMQQGDGNAIGQVRGNATYAALGIVPDDPALAEAIGPRLTGGLHFEWTEDAPLKLTDLVVSGMDYGITGQATLQGLSDEFNLSADGRVAFKAEDLSRFAKLSGLEIEGDAALEVEGSVFPLSGIFDIVAEGTGTELRIGQERVDPLLQGKSRLDLAIQRGASGTEIKRFNIANDHLSAETRGLLATGSSSLSLKARISDTARISDGLSGAATLSGNANQTGETWDIDLSATGPGASRAATKAVVSLENGEIARIEGTLDVDAKSLSPFSELAGRRLSGGGEANVDGWFDPRDGVFEASFSATGANLGTGVQLADELLRGNSSLTGKVLRGSGGVVTADRVELITPQARALITGTATDDSTSLNFDASLNDLAIIAPDGISGRAEATGTADLVGQSWQVELRGTGPGGTNAQVSGQVASDVSRANLAMTGAVPLALANGMFSPNQVAGQARFDLNLDGPLELSSLSGQVQTNTGRFILPEQQLTIAPISATVSISGGRASIEGNGAVSSGGQANVAGSIILTSPFNGDFGVELRDVGLSDGAIYDTSVSGRITLRGPLRSGAVIAADLTLGATEVRIVEAGPSIPEVLVDLKHVNEPAKARRTRAKAGLLEQGSSGGADTAGPVYPIDVLLRAPSRIFVRGRGLDAELGGELRLGGTTQDVIPQGRFDLIRGRLEILGKRLTLSEGYASLQGGFDPYVYLVATTQTTDVDIRIILEGLASAPEIIFSSNPGLPEDEILALLLFGRELTQISALQAVQLAAAVQTLTGGGSGFLDRLRQDFGLDDLDVRTGEDGATEATIGKYLTEEIYSDVTVDSKGESEINLNIQISPSVSGRGSVSSSGDTSLGIFFERDY